MDTQEQQLLENKALDQLLSGKSLFGKDGAFAPMLKGFIEKSLEVEMSSHLAESTEKNKRNGKGKKTLKTNIGEIAITTPTDRNSNFEPTIVKKRQT
ncbi:MAG: transposase, partial [Polaribacter sp.]